MTAADADAIFSSENLNASVLYNRSKGSQRAYTECDREHCYMFRVAMSRAIDDAAP